MNVHLKVIFLHILHLSLSTFIKKRWLCWEYFFSVEFFGEFLRLIYGLKFSSFQMEGKKV